MKEMDPNCSVRGLTEAVSGKDKGRIDSVNAW